MPRKAPSSRATSLLLALSVALLATLRPTESRASVAIAVSWENLLHESTAAAVLTAAEARSVWENGRIYTYTHVHVDRALSGELAAGADAWVRTMGGVVGEIGQMVEGEAVLVAGEQSVLFLHPGPAGAFEVTARGQGQLAVVKDGLELRARVVVRGNVGKIVLPRVVAPAVAPLLAADLLHDRSVDAVAREVATAWTRTHAR